MTPYVVVRNHEDQYSIWFADRALPAGWEAVREARPREDCLAWIEQNWTDLRPRCVRERAADAPTTPS
jgi:MbtH protein